MEIKVGDYVRTKEGYICKILEIHEEYDDEYLDWNDINSASIRKSHIVKSSPNIIDLIEVGDIIVCDNKKYAINYEFEVDYNDDYKDYEITIDDYITLFLKDGLSILTKEQFESVEYKVNE